MRWLMLAMLAVMSARGQFMEDIPRDNLLAAWVDAAYSNETLARDATGGLNLSCSGGVSFVSRAYSFDGTNDMLFASVANFGAASTSGTIVARVFLTAPTTTTFRILLSADNASATSFGVLQVSSGCPLWDNMSGAGTESFLTGTGAGIVTGQWATVHFATDGLFGQLGINGASVPQTTNNAGGNFAGRWFSNVSGADHVAVANFKRSTDSFSPGRVSAILVWTRRLTAAELMQTHLALSRYGVNQP